MTCDDELPSDVAFAMFLAGFDIRALSDVEYRIYRQLRLRMLGEPTNELRRTA